LRRWFLAYFLILEIVVEEMKVNKENRIDKDGVKSGEII